MSCPWFWLACCVIQLWSHSVGDLYRGSTFKRSNVKCEVNLARLFLLPHSQSSVWMISDFTILINISQHLLEIKFVPMFSRFSSQQKSLQFAKLTCYTGGKVWIDEYLNARPWRWYLLHKAWSVSFWKDCLALSKDVCWPVAVYRTNALKKLQIW